MTSPSPLPASLPLPRVKRVTKKQTNLYLTVGRPAVAAQVAQDRYNQSLSEMVDEFLQREIAHKAGVLRAPLAIRGGGIGACKIRRKKNPDKAA